MAARARRKTTRAGGGRFGRRLKLPVWATAVLLLLGGGWFLTQPKPRQEEVRALLENYVQRNKRVDLIDVVRDIYQLYYSDAYVRTPLPAGNEIVYAGAPEPDGFPHAVRVLVNRGYVVGYSDALKNPVWVAYRVRDVKTLPAPAPRPERFEVDQRTAARVPPEAYANSGYDRGHLAPNYAIATRFGEAAQRETFLMSNIAPQRHALNAGPWKQLEMKIATSYPARFGEVWVLAGPIFGSRPSRLPNGTVIPEAFYMIMVDESDGRVRTQAFIVPQEAGEGAALDTFGVSIDDVQRRTQLDFLTRLEDTAERSLETRPPGRMW